MELSIYLAQIIVFCGIINVWLIRKNKRTIYRGLDSDSLTEEFKSYGYPVWFFYFVGFLKILFAFFILFGFWFKQLIIFGSLGISILMLGAIFSHFKVKDALNKYIPATLMFVLSTFLLTSHL